MAKNTRRNQISFMARQTLRHNSSGEVFQINPMPDSVPYPLECDFVSYVYPEVRGKLYFEPGEQGRLIKCVSANDEKEFPDMQSFVNHLKARVSEETEEYEWFLECMKQMDADRENWRNLDDN
ncbi:hypothetical protein Q0M94_03510 [Deinococcus radiomollis]|uniref:hypothetical protein n=1 Tax=Deinococcus radiomollis TaxID=468916 RepID=UPI003891D220